MKRGSPLKRLTPLRAKTPIRSTARLVTRTPLRQVSDKQRDINKRRAELLREMRRGQDWCTRCGVRGQHLDGHERLRRSQGGKPDDRTEIILICRPCHEWIGANVAHAVADGWAVYSWQRRKDQL